MNTAIDKPRDPMRDFQEKIAERLRRDIGELLPQEALAKMVERAVEEQFFKPRIVSSVYGRDTTEKPPFFVEEVTKQAEGMVREAAKQWLIEHPEVIEQQVRTFLQRGALRSVVQYIDQQFNARFVDLTSDIIRQILEMGRS